MDARSIGIEELAAYVEAETERWRRWLEATPEALDVPLGPGAEGTVRTLVKHVFAVELRYAQRLAGQPVTGYGQLDDRTVASLWRVHRAAVSVRDRFLATATEADLERVLVSQTRKLGPVAATARVVLVHTLVHGIRHWAQVATVLRQHGHGGLWEHDWLLSPAVRGAGAPAA